MILRGCHFSGAILLMPRALNMKCDFLTRYHERQNLGRGAAMCTKIPRDTDEDDKHWDTWSPRRRDLDDTC